MSPRLRTIASLLLVFGLGCNCGGNLRHTSTGLVASPATYDFGKTGVSVAACAAPSATTTITLTNQGAVLIDVSGAAVTKDARNAFTATLTPGELAPGDTMKLTVGYAPPSPCPSASTPCDSATIVVSSDSGEVDVTVTGTGIDLCMGITCNPTGTGSGVTACGGLCCAGKCKYPSGVPCADPAQCLTNGTCDGSGHCLGACSGNNCCVNPPGNCCVTPPSTTCGATGTAVQTLPTPGTCNGAGMCQYGGTPTIVQCNCGCAQQSNGMDACNFSWTPLTGAPAGEYASVWTSSTGDLWAAQVNRSGANATVNPQTVYHRTGNSWAKSAMVNYAQSPICSGPGCGLILAGDGSGNIYGVADCKDSMCSAGGVWHNASGTVTDEWFNPANFGGSCGTSNVANTPFTAVFPVGGTAFALDSDPCGPELVQENSPNTPAWKILHPFNTQCGSPGTAIWGTSAMDLFISVGCGSGGAPGNIYHWDGSNQSSSFTFPTNGQFAVAMFGSSDSDIWAVGTNRWHYNGTAWTTDPAVVPSIDQTLWGNGTDYFAGGSYPDIYHYTSATDWVLECVSDNGAGSLADPNVYSIWGDNQSPPNFYAATSIGLMKRQ
jgi:hypothetical protein